MLILTQSQVRGLADMSLAVDVVARACAEYAAGRADIPMRTELHVSERNAGTMFMPGYLPGFQAIGCKMLAEFPSNPAAGLPVLTGLFTLLDFETGLPAAVMDALYLTVLRTGALTGVAAKYLAPDGARRAVVLGTGGLAACQVWALTTCVPSLEDVQVWGRRPKRADEVVRQVVERGWAEPSRLRRVGDAGNAVRGADIVVTATSARAPVIDASWVRTGTLVCGMGGHEPEVQELPTDVVAGADKVYADSRQGVLGRAGDVLAPIREGRLSADRVWELGHVVSGERPAREQADERIVFKSCGFAALDLALGSEVWRLARDRQAGVDVDLLS